MGHSNWFVVGGWVLDPRLKVIEKIKPTYACPTLGM
jgi:hypothetical protein